MSWTIHDGDTREDLVLAGEYIAEVVSVAECANTKYLDKYDNMQRELVFTFEIVEDLTNGFPDEIGKTVRGWAPYTSSMKRKATQWFTAILGGERLADGFTVDRDLLVGRYAKITVGTQGTRSRVTAVAAQP